MMAAWNNNRDFSLLYGCGHHYDRKLCICAYVYVVVEQ